MLHRAKLHVPVKVEPTLRCNYCDYTWPALLPGACVIKCPACRKITLLLEANAEGVIPFGDCDLLGEVGQGANAAVCRARRQQTGEIVAVKLFLSVNQSDEHALREFKRESEIAARIIHPHIVRLFEGGEVDGVPYLVIEFVDGLNTAQWLLRRGPLPVNDVFAIGEDVCAALDYVWSNYLMIHRDIKPQNIMLAGKDRQVKVCDFGMVLPHEQASVDLNAVEGTPYYISPECIQEGAYQDNRSDIYSLGATLYHLIAGQPPFDYASLMDVVQARIKEPAPDIRAVVPGVSAAAADVLRTMMSRDTDDRYVTAAECCEDLRRVRQGKMPQLVDRLRPRVNQ